MAITFVRQGTSANGKSVSSIAPSFASSPANGNAIIVLVGVHAATTSDTVSSLSGLGATWATPVNLSTGNNLGSGVTIADGLTNGTGTSVTVNLSSSTATAVALITEFSGLTTTTDGTNQAQSAAGGASHQPGNITTTNANDLIISLETFGGTTVPTDPTSPWNALTAAGTSGGTGGTNENTAGIYQIVAATGSFNPTYTGTPGSGFSGSGIAAFQATVIAGNLPTMMRGPHQRHRLARIRAKHVVRNSIQLRIPPAPPAIFPPALRHQQRRKPTPMVRAKRPVKNSIELRIPPRPFPEFPDALRHRQQPKRIPRVKPKRVVRNSIELFPKQFPQLTLAARHQRVPKRLPRAKAKRVVRSSIELRIPPAPPGIFPPALRHRQQPKRRPVIKRRPVRGTLQRPRQQAAKRSLPLPIFVRHRVKRRLWIGKRPWILMFYGTHVTPPPAGQLNNPLIKSLGKMMHRIG